MQLHPTRATFQVALAGSAMIAVGIAAKVSAAIAFGGAMLTAIVLGRALALCTVTRIRASGFEMVWGTTSRVTKANRFDAIVLDAELRNRGEDDVRGVNLRPVASSMLDVSIHPSTIDLPAASSVRFTIHVRAKRVGRWGVHGIALEVRGTPLGGEGLYEVPLMFANPHGVEVTPRPLSAMIGSARGGRSRRLAETGKSASLAGGGEHLKELREHAAGDAFKRIAWKASARRGKLLVREMEREERDIIWLVLDASVELWAGTVGSAPLDAAIDDIANVAASQLSRGESVGLIILGSCVRTWLLPAKGPIQAAKVAEALLAAATFTDAERCELDETELAARVAEHLRPLDPRGLVDVSRGNLDALARRAEAMRSRAPFPILGVAHEATANRDACFRHYLASFGIEVPPRIDGERERAEIQLATVLETLAVETDRKTKPSIVHVWASAVSVAESRAGLALRKLRTRRIDVRWTMPLFDIDTAPRDGVGSRTATSIENVVRNAVRIRVCAAEARAERTMRGLGVRTRASQARRWDTRRSAE